MTPASMVEMTGVGTLNEKSLHAQLKVWCSQAGDRFEVPVGRHVIDIVRGELLIEIQTRNVSAVRNKLATLLEEHRVRLVFPIPASKTLVKLGPGGEIVSRRRSPKRGSVFDIFAELVSITTLIDHPSFDLRVLLIDEVELREHTPHGNWRRKGWRTVERRLESVLEEIPLSSTGQLLELIPPLPGEWTTADIAETAGVSLRVAQQVAYTLKHTAAAVPVAKRGNAVVYIFV